MVYVVEDSSFVISLLDNSDSLHKSALETFQVILSHQEKTKAIIPSTVFYETMFVLLKNGVSYQTAKTKLNNLMLIDNIVNYAITETTILKLAKHTQKLIEGKTNKTRVRSHDLLIASIACNQEASCLITADIGMKDYLSVCPNIFLYNTTQGKEDLNNFLSS